MEREKKIEKIKSFIAEFGRFTIAIVLCFVAFIGIMLTINKVEIHEVNVGTVLLGLEIAFLVFSFTILHQGDVGMMSILGTPIKNTGPGFYFTPAGIVKIRKELGTVFQNELPADPEKIFRGDGVVPQGMFPPIRVKFGQPGPIDNNPNSDPEKEKNRLIDLSLKDDPYNVAMVAEVVPVVSWHIEDATVFFGGMGTVEKCLNILADKSIELFGDEFASVTPAKAMLALKETSQKLEDILVEEAKVKNWGIKINDAYVKPIVFTHELNSAVIGVSIAQQNAKALIHKAEGEAKAVQITADAEKMRLTKTGLAKTDNEGNISELVPDANVRANTDALKELSNVTGTLVLGQGVFPVMDIQKQSTIKEKDVQKEKGEGGKK